MTSEQVVGEQDTAVIVQAGTEITAKLAGRDPTTNVAVFRLETPLAGALPAQAELCRGSGPWR